MCEACEVFFKEKSLRPALYNGRGSMKVRRNGSARNRSERHTKGVAGDQKVTRNERKQGGANGAEIRHPPKRNPYE